MNRLKSIIFLSLTVFAVGCATPSEEKTDKVGTTGAQDRAYCIQLMQKIVDPVLIPLSEQRLDQVLPRKEWETSNDKCDIRTTNIQAVGRSLSGLAPWLSLGKDETPEGKLRAKYIDLSLKAIINITDPTSADYLFDKDSETYERIVHGAYLAYPLLLAPKQLWEPLAASHKENVIKALKSHRNYQPFNNNWLLFASVIEAAIWKLTGDCEMEKLTYGINKHMEWYVGDGMYGDGSQFHWDYYNSYVIHPLLMEVLKVCKEKEHPLKELYPIELGRAKRYAEIQEHLISPEGTFPVIGRSGAYRIAAFQLLGYMVYRDLLPSTLEPGSTRAALMAVTRRVMEAPGTFDEQGWLNPGVVGKQINSRDVYTFTGSLYMVTMGLTQLGLPADAPFWTDPAGKWFQQKVWSGDDIPGQHEYYGE